VRRWIRLAARLYPARWRQRYGAEFDALIEDAACTWRDVLDVLRGALEIHMNSWSFRKLASVCAVAGAAVAAGVALQIPDRYVSEAVFRLSGEAPPQYFRDQVLERAFSRDALTDLITRDNLYPADRRQVPLENVVGRMRHDIGIKMLPNVTGDPRPSAVLLQYRYPNPAQAQSTTRELVSKIVEANLVAAEAKAGHRLTVQLASPPSLPQAPGSPNRLVITAGGVAAGVLLAAIAVLAMRFRRQPA